MTSPSMLYLEHLQQLALTSDSDSIENQLQRENSRSYLRDQNNATRTRAKILREEIFGDSAEYAHESTTYEDIESRYSRFEDPIFAHMVDNARGKAETYTKKLIEEGVAQGKIPIDYARDVSSRIDMLVVGSLPRANLNASAIRVPKSDVYVVVMNEGVPRILARLARIICDVFASASHDVVSTGDSYNENPEKNYAEIVYRILEKPESKYLIDNFEIAIAHYFGFKRNDKYQHKLFKGPARMLSESITIGSEVFIFAHELAHILEPNKPEEIISNCLPDSTEIDIISRSQAIELSADVSALACMRQWLRPTVDDDKQDIEPMNELLTHWTSMGPIHFFSTAIAIEIFQRDLNATSELSDTHPKSRDRLYYSGHLLSNWENSVDQFISQYTTIVSTLISLTHQRIVSADRNE